MKRYRWRLDDEFGKNIKASEVVLVTAERYISWRDSCMISVNYRRRIISRPNRSRHISFFILDVH